MPIDEVSRRALDLWADGWSRAMRGEAGYVLVNPQGIPIVPRFASHGDAQTFAIWNYRGDGQWANLAAKGWKIMLANRTQEG